MTQPSAAKPLLLLILLLVVGFSATYFLQRQSFNSIRQIQQDNFDFQTREIKFHIEQRLVAYEQILLGTKGLFISSKKVTRDMFHKYVGNLHLEDHYQGIQGIGFSLIIQPSEKAKHITAIHKEGFPDYTLRPEGERSLYTSIIYLEPFNDRNQRAFGYDMFSEKVRRTAMEQARDLDTAIISGKVKLVQETEQHVQAGFLMYVPVYRNDLPHDSQDERRSNIIGWAYSPFRMDDLMHGILGEQVENIHLEIYDGKSSTPETLMYHTEGLPSLGRSDEALFNFSKYIELNGHIWTVEIHSLPTFETSIDVGRIMIIRVTGILMTIMLTVLIWLLSSGRMRALKLADIMTQELRESENAFKESNNLLKSIIANVPIRVFWKDSNFHYLGCNNLFAQDAGYLSSDEVVGKTDYEMIWNDLADLYRADDKQTIESGNPKLNFEEQLIRPDGGVDWIQTSKTPLLNVKNQVIGILGIYQDITERKKIDLEIKIASIAFESQEGITVNDANGDFLKVNKAFTRITGYTTDEVIGKNPRILSSGRHDAVFYATLWDTIIRTGAWEGEIWNRRKNGEIYPESLTIAAIKDQQGAIIHFVSTHTDITKIKAAEEEIKQLAFYDPLTHLPNRRLFRDRLQRTLASVARSGLTGGLLFVDLDNFKSLNDSLGHHIGDLLLQQVAERLESCMREGDTVARLGGDEFVIMLENLSKDFLVAAELTNTVGNKILATLNQPYQLAIHEHRNTPSIGATLFNDNRYTIDELMQQADIAMYQSKKAGRNMISFFDSRMQESVNTRALLERDLHKALETHQFQLYYQIQVDGIETDGSPRPLGAEALIRWVHPERGLVFPAEFIPIAEETGLIFPIGQWVLETACAQIQTWQQNPLTQELTLAVNISIKHFCKPDFVAQIRAVIQRYHINPMLLKMELTESLLLENIDDTIAKMNALNEMGVQFSLDDFGTGYSSLQYLKQLPLYQLKIDQSFVRNLAFDISDKAIVHTIIAMAESLDMGVIAEGVETKEQMKRLLQKGCTRYQGYLFGKPMPIEQFEALLIKN